MNGTAMRFDAAQAYAKWPYSFTSLFMLTVVWARAIRTCGPIHSWILLAVLALRMGPGLLWAQVVTPQSEPSGHARGIQANSSAGQPGTDAWRQRRDYALLFATNEYATWEPLINPIPDAEAIAAELRDNYGFQAEVVRNPTREQIVSKQRDYSQRKFGEGDQLFIFFAGHGVFDDVFKQGYIVARDSRKDDDETRGGYESHDNLRTIVNSMRARHILLVMDA
jgi:hypothetical protein